MTPPRGAAQLDAFEAVKRDRGHADALAHLSPFDASALRGAILWLVGYGRPFTSDDVDARLTPECRERLKLVPNAKGAVWRQVALSGVMEVTGRSVPSVKPGARKRRLSEWRAK